MGSRGVRVRKTRSDKKRDISPTVSIELRECIYRLSFITSTPVKDVAEAICINGLTTPKVVEYMAQYFKRDIRFAQTIYMKNPNCLPIQKRSLVGQTARISIRFKSDTHDTISALAYAMDCTVSRACAVLLDASVRDGDFKRVRTQILEANIDDSRMKELRKVLRYINADNPYGEEYTWVNLLSLMVDEMRTATAKVADAATDFVFKHWRDGK